MSNHNIMTTKELAEYIKLNEKTVIKMAQTGEIPGIKVGNQWRFHLMTIDDYLQGRLVKSSDSDLDKVINTANVVVPLSRLIREETIILDLKSLTKSEALEELSIFAEKISITVNQKVLLDELNKREKMLSTALGNGIAVPHPRNPSPELFNSTGIILARSSAGIEFDAPDKKKVHLFFMCCADNEFTHIRYLAKVSKFLHVNKIFDSLMNAADKNKIMQILLEYERDSFVKKS